MDTIIRVSAKYLFVLYKRLPIKDCEVIEVNLFQITKLSIKKLFLKILN